MVDRGEFMEQEMLQKEVIDEVFFARSTEWKEKAEEDGGCLVHYTSAQAAVQIIKSKKFWLRNHSFMNDTSEVKHGIGLLEKALEKDGGGNLKKSLDQIRKDFSVLVMNKLKEYLNSPEVFIGCFCVPKSDWKESGKLSMWRGYGGNCGVAFFLNLSAFTLEKSPFNLVTSPVEYLDVEGFSQRLGEISCSVDKNLKTLKGFPADRVANAAFGSLFALAVSTKHKGFREEEECRLLYFPKLFPSPVLEKMAEVEVIGAQPQLVYKVPLSGELGGVPFNDLFGSLLIGPTSNPNEIKSTFEFLLKEAGVEEPQVNLSNIPLRT